MASSGDPTREAPTYRAWTAAKRFIVADSGPGSQTREPGPRSASAETWTNDSNQDPVVRTTERGRLVVPDVRSAMS
nr:hypothetical protein [Geodermatophilus chilensis]